MEHRQLVMFEAVNSWIVVRSGGVCMKRLSDPHCGIDELGLLGKKYFELEQPSFNIAVCLSVWAAELDLK